MTLEERKEIIRQIEELAGRLGAESTLENTSDTEEYEFQVHCGLSEAVADILRGEPFMVSYWLGFCVRSLGYDPTQESFQSIREDLDNFFDTADRN